VFKKVDSVLRGHVRAEIEAILAACDLASCVLAPANPSRGRVIVAGEYWIAGKPLDQTDFAKDPEHPRRSASVATLLGKSARTIVVPDVLDLDGLGQIAKSIGDGVLAAGAADFFKAVLSQSGRSSEISIPRDVELTPPAVLICGSLTVLEARRKACASAGLTVVPCASADQEWLKATTRLLKSHGAVMVATGDLEPVASKNKTAFGTFTAAAAELIRQANPATILAEGGATAAALARHLGWSRLATVATAAEGVGVLRPLNAETNAMLVVKPGSYDWPEVIWSQFVGLR